MIANAALKPMGILPGYELVIHRCCADGAEGITGYWIPPTTIYMAPPTKRADEIKQPANILDRIESWLRSLL